MATNNSEYYREKARELRLLAKQMHYPEHGTELLRLADAFDQLAMRVGGRAVSEAAN